MWGTKLNELKSVHIDFNNRRFEHITHYEQPNNNDPPLGQHKHSVLIQTN